MTRTSNSYTGDNGTFTAVYYRRSGEWFPGVFDWQTKKRTYASGVRSSWAAAEAAMEMAKKAAGENAMMILNDRR